MMKASTRVLLALLALGARSTHAEDASGPAAGADVAVADVEVEAAPARAEPPEPAASSEEELAALEGELASVMDALVSARARAGVLARALFQSQLSVSLVRRADAQRLEALEVTLDGVAVHQSDGAVLQRDTATLFTGYVVPGMHELGVTLRERARADDAFGYTRRERFQVKLAKGVRTEAELIVRDDSDMAKQAAEGDDGEYQLETTLRVRSTKVRSTKVRD